MTTSSMTAPQMPNLTRCVPWAVFAALIGFVLATPALRALFHYLVMPPELLNAWVAIVFGVFGLLACMLIKLSSAVAHYSPQLPRAASQDAAEGAKEDENPDSLRTRFAAASAQEVAAWQAATEQFVSILLRIRLIRRVGLAAVVLLIVMAPALPETATALFPQPDMEAADAFGFTRLLGWIAMLLFACVAGVTAMLFEGVAQSVRRDQVEVAALIAERAAG